MKDVPRTWGSRRTILLLVVAAWLLVVVAAAATAVAAMDYLTVREARTPELTGRSLADAERLVADAGLSLRSYPVVTRGIDADTIVEQAPPAGTVVRAGRVINVGVHVPAEVDRMPSLVGVAEDDALATLRGLSLPAPDLTYVAADDRAGRVIEQTPSAGTTVSIGDDVTLVVSRGPEQGRVELPDLVGLDTEAARAQLAALGVRRVEAVAVGVSMLRPGTVTQQRPEPGSVVRVGEPVMLGYALEGDRVTNVPDVAGLEPWRARVALRSAGLALGPIEIVERPDEPEGVVGSRPSGLTVAGAPVTLVINAPGGETGDLADFRDADRGDLDVDVDADRDASPFTEDDDATERTDANAGRTVPFRFDPAELGVRSLIERDYDLRLVVRDEEGERVVLDRRVTAGEEVRTTVVVQGDEPLLQTYVNGVFFQAWRP